MQRIAATPNRRTERLFRVIAVASTKVRGRPVELTLARNRRRLVEVLKAQWSPRWLRDVPFTLHTQRKERISCIQESLN